jgi:Restriction endonuclease
LSEGDDRAAGWIASRKVPLRLATIAVLAAQQLRQLGDVGCYPPRLIVREDVCLPGLVIVAAEVGVDAVETAASANDKGRALEELCSRLFSSVPGFAVTGRIRTATEEIDISILNNSSEPRLRREGAVILAECKNWTGKCGKNELVLFQQKIENRNQRCSLGVLISWNGFAETVSKELLRGSREGTLVVPLTGESRAIAEFC